MRVTCPGPIPDPSGCPTGATVELGLHARARWRKVGESYVCEPCGHVRDAAALAGTRPG